MQTVYLAQFTLTSRTTVADAGGRKPMGKPRSGQEAKKMRLAGGAGALASTGESVRDLVIRHAQGWLDAVADEHGTIFPPTGATDCTGSEGESLSDGGTWRATFEHPYRHPILNIRNVRQCIEITVGPDDRPGGECAFTIRLEHDATSMLRERMPIEPPALVAGLVDTFAASAGGTPLTAATHLYDRANMEGLIDLLTQPGRVVPVVVISKQADSQPIVEPTGIARHLAGVAYVAELRDHDAAFALSDAFTKQLSCYNGAVRIYWPGFSRDSEMYDHRLWLDQKLLTGDIAQRMPDFLLREIADRLPPDMPPAPAVSASPSLAAPAAWGETQDSTLADWLSPAKLQSLLAFPTTVAVEPEPPAVAEPPPASLVDMDTAASSPAPLATPPVAPVAAEAVVAPVPEMTTPATAPHASPEVLIEAVERQFAGAFAAQEALLEGLKIRLDSFQQAAHDFESVGDALERLENRLGNFQIRLAMLEGDNRAMRRENDALRGRLGQLQPNTPARRLPNRAAAEDTSEQASGAMDDLYDAALSAEERHGGPHVIFLDAAYTSASDSPLRKGYVDKAYNYLGAICDVARRHHAGELDGGFRDAFAQYGIEFSSKISDTAATQHSDQYTFVWKREDGTTETIMAGPHVGFGNGSDEKLLRVYWHWDKADRRFVICHIGRHLSGKST